MRVNLAVEGISNKRKEDIPFYKKLIDVLIPERHCLEDRLIGNKRMEGKGLVTYLLDILMLIGADSWPVSMASKVQPRERVFFVIIEVKREEDFIVCL